LSGLQYDFGILKEQNKDLEDSVDHYKDAAAKYKKLYDACVE